MAGKVIDLPMQAALLGYCELSQPCSPSNPGSVVLEGDFGFWFISHPNLGSRSSSVFPDQVTNGTDHLPAPLLRMLELIQV